MNTSVKKMGPEKEQTGEIRLAIVHYSLWEVQFGTTEPLIRKNKNQLYLFLCICKATQPLVKSVVALHIIRITADKLRPQRGFAVPTTTSLQHTVSFFFLQHVVI